MPSKSKIQRNTIQSYSWSIEQLAGLSKENQLQLLELGIKTTGELLQIAKTSTARLELANRLQLHIQYINKWVALADLARIPSVGCQYCGLLLHAGIASVSQLAQTPIHRLHPQILRLQVATMQRKDLCPSVEQVQQWIKQAQQTINN
ncbi:hypothetical protein Cri9333_4559 [Crinalium epipsammum PCC 9333]|uniref:DUF4332 domain-containing protein n=1 Tax=Crinalium epipsammum PCC 9333 TaxID=1173022 RepID=K9W6A8_9CYAN|nr:DUF4332 domain-containing protein [Crinalium epipsammum]AFZ15339.1 hypothetical protein Cri9333_4559 [Crinalium epipsammum PCC 9333]